MRRSTVPNLQAQIHKCYYILGLSLILSLVSCNEEQPCIEQSIIDSVEKSHFHLVQAEAGDSITFAKYRVLKDSGRKYSYLGNETYVVTSVDTTEKMYYENSTLEGCENKVFSYPIEIKYVGPKDLQFRIEPSKGSDDLRFLFLDKDFRISTLIYNSSLSKLYFPELKIEDKSYQYVNAAYGYEIGDWGHGTGYTDSTLVYYNSYNGILKFIVNDTLVYLRK